MTNVDTYVVVRSVARVYVGATDQGAAIITAHKSNIDAHWESLDLYVPTATEA